MKKIDFYIQLSCAIAIVISLIVYFNCISPNFFSARKIALMDLLRSCDSHESAIIKATNDFNNNKLRIPLNYLRGVDYKENDDELHRMEKEYGVLFIGGSCVCCGKYVSTYDQVMKHLINEKYGKMIFRTIDVYSFDYYSKQKKMSSLFCFY
jgi:hypothetical protein